MAFSTGKKTTESGPIKRYIGVASCYVLGVNPNAKELSEIYGREIDNVPQYTSVKEVNGKNVETIRIDFYLKPDTKLYEDVDFVTKISFFLRNEHRFNSPDKEVRKIQVIDKYGRTAWATKEELKNKTIPQYANGPAKIDSDYRPLYVGEEELTSFIKNYLNIPNLEIYVKKTGTYIPNPNPSECEARLDDIESYFKENIAELKTILSLQPENKVKVLIGVRTADDGKLYQDVYSNMTLKNGVRTYTKLAQNVEESKSNGRYSNTEFVCEDLVEYAPKPTNFNPIESTEATSTDDSDLPWD